MKKIAPIVLLIAAGCADRPLCIGGLCRMTCSDEGGCDGGGPGTVTVSPLGALTALQVDLTDPPQVGSPSRPIAAKTATFDISALDGEGKPYTDPIDVEVYVSFGGVRAGADTACGSDSSGTPIATVHVVGGVQKGVQITLPHPFSATSVWVEERISHAAGASPTMYFRGPTIPELQTPPDLKAANATFCSTFNRKVITVDTATGQGALVVTSVFGNAFAVTDTGANLFSSVYVYSFGKPPSEIVPGRRLSSFSGNVSKFVGFTELNFPLWSYPHKPAPDDQQIVPVDLTLVPPPFEIKWDKAFPLSDPMDPMSGRIIDVELLLGHCASVVKFLGTVCDPMSASNVDSWKKFNQFVLDGEGNCEDTFNNFAIAMPSKTLGKFDPLAHVGGKVTIVGMLKNNSGQNSVVGDNGREVACSFTSDCPGTSKCVDKVCKKGVFNFWSILPRAGDDFSY